MLPSPARRVRNCWISFAIAAHYGEKKEWGNVIKRLGYQVAEGPDVLVRPGYYRDLIRFAKKELGVDPER